MNALPDASVSETQEEDRPTPPAARLGFWLGLAAFAGLLLAPAPDGLSGAGWHTAAVGVLMAVWWMTEALPIPVTALVPLVLFPLLGVADAGDAAAPYANPLIFLFLGGFVLAKGMERWHLHRRLALGLIARVGTSPRRLVLGFVAASGLLSMGISNTATALMMLPIGLSVVEVVRGEETRSFGIALMLGIAYACSVGGMATLIGTPTNALLAGFVHEAYGVDLSFAGWFAVGLPLALVGLALVYAALTRLTFRIGTAASPEAQAFVQAERAAMGPTSTPERRVAVVFGVVAALWITRPLLDTWLPGLTDTGIAVAGALTLFALPAGTGDRLLDWESARTLPWGVLLLFGGGLSLAAAVQATGLAGWIGAQLEAAQMLPSLFVVGLVVTVVVFLTEMTSNTATAAAFLPVLGGLALGLDPFPLLAAAALAASCAFMLPVATPPNAIVYSSDRLSVRDMARAGIVLNLTFIVLLSLVATYVFPLLVGSVLPALTP